MAPPHNAWAGYVYVYIYISIHKYIYIYLYVCICISSARMQCMYSAQNNLRSYRYSRHSNALNQINPRDHVESLWSHHLYMNLQYIHAWCWLRLNQWRSAVCAVVHKSSLCCAVVRFSRNPEYAIIVRSKRSAEQVHGQSRRQQTVQSNLQCIAIVV